MCRDHRERLNSNWLMTRTHRYEHETMDINEGRNESRDQRINESIDDIRSEDIDDILNGSIDSNWKKSTSDSMQNYVYLSLESMSKRDQAPENHFNYSVSTSIINEMQLIVAVRLFITELSKVKRKIIILTLISRYS
nr:PREDICTED: uncharacterized protein LOC105671607 [Linepithema humile]